MLRLMELVLISGLSGSGKSVALHLLEDAGYYCVDNLPVVMLTFLVRMLQEGGISKMAVAIDARSGHGIELLPERLRLLSEEGTRHTFLFLHASDETLLKRYSESRRRHPLTVEGQSLEETIRAEREMLEPISTLGHRIDTSGLKANALREWVRQFIEAAPGQGLTLMFQSFGFKHGIPLDADLVFDVRCLPNPHYDPELRLLTGKDQPVVDFLEAEPEVIRMRDDIQHFIATWLPAYIRDNRNYLTVAIGCTGGQHRSVYLAEWLGRAFANEAQVLIRHRTLAGG
jgi:RNase adapter protein RapZ